MYEIEDGVPLPKKQASTRPRKFPFHEMTRGQSVFIPDRTVASMGPRIRFVGKKFTSRTVTENGIKGVRVWRIE